VSRFRMSSIIRPGQNRSTPRSRRLNSASVIRHGRTSQKFQLR
jgi:hypothetical protein